MKPPANTALARQQMAADAAVRPGAVMPMAESIYGVGKMTTEKGTNRAVRRENRNRIFRYICKHGRSSNPAIASALKMSLPTVLQNTRELLACGILRDAGELDSTGGRKAKTVDVVSNYRCSVGIDITREHIILVLTNLSGENVDRERVYLPFRDEEEYFRQMRVYLQEFLVRNQVEKEKLLGVGFSIPGIINHHRNRIDRSHVLGLSDYPLEHFSGDIPCRTWFMNDANAGAFAEGFHAEKGDHFFYLSLNNTVGGGFYDGEQLLRGDHYRVGEVGHLIIVPDGKRCYCGQRGCSDPYLSAQSLAEESDNSMRCFFERLNEGRDDALRRWEEYVRILAILIHNIHVTLDCDIIIGGYVGSAIGQRIEDVRNEVRRLDLFEQEAGYIRPCVFQISESAFGAALYEMETFLSQV